MLGGLLKADSDSKSRVIPVTDLTIRQAFALMKQADLYVGNDTSLLNIAASLGTVAVGLFGGSTPLTYSSNIKVITPAEPPLSGPEKGMKAISVQEVWDRLMHLKLI